MSILYVGDNAAESRLPCVLRRKVTMRKLMIVMNSTLNGIVTGDPSKDKTNFMVWTSDATTKSGSESLLEVLRNVDTTLYGRATYEDLSRMEKWPGVKDWPGVTELDLTLGNIVNDAHKLVVTSDDSLELEWGEYEAPRRLPATDIEAQIRALKNSEGGDIVIFGSPTLVRTLTDANLIDEYNLYIYPVVATVGEHLFDSLKARKDFELVGAKPLEGGLVLVTYRPTGIGSR